LAESLPDDANEPLWGLVALISERVAAFEHRARPKADVPPREILRELMTEWELKQQDLPEVGTQSVVSEILSGKRAMNLRQIKALSRRFGVSPAVFMG
jgi:HTH-type transcriptional regulator/antitoxin HigA